MSSTPNHTRRFVDRTILNPRGNVDISSEGKVPQGAPQPEIRPLISEHPIDGIASFCRLVSELGVKFKTRSTEKPWALRAGEGGCGVVECHRYVPGRQFNSFNTRDKATNGLKAHASDPTRTGQYYAVKRLTAYSAGGDGQQLNQLNSERLNQLATELRILAHLPMRNHPNILQLIGVEFLLAEPVLVLEDANCGSLSQFMKCPERSAMFTRQVFELKWNFCLDIARGLEVLHNHGVIHGDIKDDNILIFCHDTNHYQANRMVISDSTCRNFSAKLCDFGLSTILTDENSEEVLPKGSTKGWAAPEVESKVSITKEMLPKIDIYSAGVVFATLFLGGTHPFDAFAATLSSTATRTAVLEILKNPEIKPLNLAQYALTNQKLITELQPGFKVNMGSWYCGWELERICKLLDHTYAESPQDRLDSGSELVKSLQVIWQAPTWRSHRERCTGTVAEFEVGVRETQMEVFMEGHIEPPRAPWKCSGPEW
jgi:serine/threonine protein kinase